MSRKTCTCKAYPFPHRPGSGLCRWPDPPAERFQGKAGQNAPVGMRRRSAIRRRLIRKYAFHPIRDREAIRRWIPKLYVAWCRRHGYPSPEGWFGGYVPAMLVTAEGPRAANAPKPGPFPPGYRFGGWQEAIYRERRHKPLRSVQKRLDRAKRALPQSQRRSADPPGDGGSVDRMESVPHVRACARGAAGNKRVPC